MPATIPEPSSAPRPPADAAPAPSPAPAAPRPSRLPPGRAALAAFSIALRAGVGVAALAASVAVFAYFVGTKPKPERRTDAQPPITVLAVGLGTHPVPRTFEGYGTARSMNAVELPAEVEGLVVERPEAVEAGRAIRAGDLIVRVDPSDYERRAESLSQDVEALFADLAALEIEQARLREQADLSREEFNVAQREMERMRSLRDQGVGNESELDNRVQLLNAANRALVGIQQQLDLIPSRRAATEARLAARRADLRTAQRDLERCTIRSPITGGIQRVDVEPGEWVARGRPVARLVGLDFIEVPLRLPLAAAAFVARGDQALLRPDGDDGRTWRGTVSRIAPEAESATRSMTVYVEVRQEVGQEVGQDASASADGTGLLLPGQFVLGRVEASTRAATLVVPRRVVNVDRVLIAEPLPESDPLAEEARRAGAQRVMRVREVGVSVSHYTDGELPEVDPAEREWAVLTDDADSPQRLLRPGDLLLLSNLEQLVPGRLIDVRLPGDPAPPPPASATEPAPPADAVTVGQGDAR